MKMVGFGFFLADVRHVLPALAPRKFLLASASSATRSLPDIGAMRALVVGCFRPLVGFASLIA
jgi:hypothetical protein